MLTIRSSTLLLLTSGLIIGCSSEDPKTSADDQQTGSSAGGSIWDRWQDEEEGDGGRGEGTNAGSGGSENNQNPNEPAPPTDPAEPVDPGTENPTTCADQEDWDPAWTAWEDEVLVIVNKHRSEGASCGGEQFAPTGSLSTNAALRCAARLHSMDMVDQNYFDHTSLDGRSPWERMEAAGFESGAGGENIAAGQGSPEGVMESWMSSPGHCSNIMSPDFDLIGVGYYPGGDFRHMWTQTFGSD